MALDHAHLFHHIVEMARKGSVELALHVNVRVYICLSLSLSPSDGTVVQVVRCNPTEPNLVCLRGSRVLRNQ